MPADRWPDPVLRALKHMNPAVYVPMQGPSELGLTGALEDWDRASELQRIEVPTLVIGARYDTMDPEQLEWMAGVYVRDADADALAAAAAMDHVPAVLPRIVEAADGYRILLPDDPGYEEAVVAHLPEGLPLHRLRSGAPAGERS